MKQDPEIGPSLACVFSSEGLRAALNADRPDLDPNPVLHELRAFAVWRGAELSLSTPPSRQEVGRYLAECSMHFGDHSGAAQVQRVLTAAPILWGMPYASMIAIILRQKRCTPKTTGKSKMDTLWSLIARLPDEWQPGLVARMISEPGNPKLKWSVDHLTSVTHALLRWLGWCENLGHDARPTGVTFHAYAGDLHQEGVSTRSVSN